MWSQLLTLVIVCFLYLFGLIAAIYEAKRLARTDVSEMTIFVCGT